MALSATMRRMQEAEVKAGRKAWLGPPIAGVLRCLTGCVRPSGLDERERGYDADMAEMALPIASGRANVPTSRSDIAYERTAAAMMADWGAAIFSAPKRGGQGPAGKNRTSCRLRGAV